jgi:hypothetical protein
VDLRQNKPQLIIITPDSFYFFPAKVKAAISLLMTQNSIRGEGVYLLVFPVGEVCVCLLGERTPIFSM